MEFLHDEVKEAILGFPFIKKYLEGRLDRETFLEDLDKFKENGELAKRIPNRYIEQLYEYSIQRIASYNRFERFALKSGLAIATIQDKIDWIRNQSVKGIFNFLPISNGLITQKRGILKWMGQSIKTLVTVGDDVNLEPPDQSHVQFEQFINLMKINITLRNSQVWAAKLFIAINFAHMFPDGNGRLAKHMYYTLRKDGVLDEERAARGNPTLIKLFGIVNENAIFIIMRKNGVNVPRVSKISDYRAMRDEEDDKGLISSLKYVAARYVLQKHKALYMEHKRLMYGNWPVEWMSEFMEEYQKVRIDWFWEGIDFIEKNAEWSVKELDKSIS